MLGKIWKSLKNQNLLYLLKLSMYFVFDTQRQSKASVGYFAQVSNMAPGSLYISYYQKIIVFHLYIYNWNGSWQTY